jgi:two-component system response regulator (stage 0 sporulation protein A)
MTYVRSPAENLRETAVRAVVLRFGIPAHVEGYDYICEGILYVIAEPQLLRPIKNKLYPLIATRRGITAHGVEQGIRYALCDAPMYRCNPVVYEYFGESAARANYWTPTNKEFIKVVANRLRQQFNSMEASPWKISL